MGVIHWNSNNKHEGLYLSLRPPSCCFQPGPCRRIWPSCWPSVPPVSVQAIPGRAQKYRPVQGFRSQCCSWSWPCLPCCPCLSCPSSPCRPCLSCPSCPCRPCVPCPSCPCRPCLPCPSCPCCHCLPR